MSAFRRLGTGRSVTILVNGVEIEAREGESVATALLAAGHLVFRRGTTPYCLMGVCFGCLCEIDDRPDEQACLAAVRAGMRITLEVAP